MRNRALWLLADACHVAVGAFLGFHGKGLPFVRLAGGIEGALIGAAIGVLLAIYISDVFRRRKSDEQVGDELEFTTVTT